VVVLILAQILSEFISENYKNRSTVAKVIVKTEVASFFETQARRGLLEHVPLMMMIQLVRCE